ncbi:MAG: hypothetical protein RR448_09240 [Niameybacter sp.]|uniref:hypothetical protein n=1 Tax=Niameybacter sp. TaxID=2033640 RepID=UPI002FC6E331
MINYYLTEKLTQIEILRRLKKGLEDEHIIKIAHSAKGETFVETDWYVYVIKLKKNRYTVPVMWSDSKKPYLIGGIVTVLLLMFFVGGLVSDIGIIGILVGLGLVNVFKRSEIRAMKLAIEEALGKS